jgi:hypothetical protein
MERCENNEHKHWSWNFETMRRTCKHCGVVEEKQGDEWVEIDAPLMENPEYKRVAIHLNQKRFKLDAPEGSIKQRQPGF